MPRKSILPGNNEEMVRTETGEEIRCLGSAFRQRHETYTKTMRFVDCEGKCENCILSCQNLSKDLTVEIALYSQLVKEAFAFARYLYAVLKSLESGKSPFLKENDEK